MTSLREEIQDTIYKKIGGKEHVGIRWTECQETTNEVISIFEKRIDKIRNDVMKDPPSPKDLRDFYYYRGMVATIAELKKEMLK